MEVVKETLSGVLERRSRLAIRCRSAQDEPRPTGVMTAIHLDTILKKDGEEALRRTSYPSPTAPIVASDDNVHVARDRRGVVRRREDLDKTSAEIETVVGTASSVDIKDVGIHFMAHVGGAANVTYAHCDLREDIYKWPEPAARADSPRPSAVGAGGAGARTDG
ncbi:hypothetical protein EVAR_23618_1 [Eumeta japonica]|uniref:Uncharacterized protein n=1 Tax=Eumeta variegata TaxID=151549 RepID=A0A4C1WXJ2_EUMVA|nr:hypothetical protein EVAR_23618_1 [Eumeta japonica]